MKIALRVAMTIAALLTCTLVNASTDWSAQDYDLYSGDFNGDGAADVLYIARDPARVSGIATSAGGIPSIAWQSWPSNYLGIPWSGGGYNVIVADFNGDGKSDLFLQRKTPGDSYVLLSDANGKISGIWQAVSYAALGLTWSADQHNILAGDFNGDGKADLFLQATSASGTNAIVAASANGQFMSGPLQSWANSYLGFKWSAVNATVSAGDFNGDGKWDLLVQAKPTIVLIDYDVPIPVPTYTPNSFGVVLSQGGATPLQLAGVQQWSRNSFGVDWSANSTNVVVADFNGDGRADALLQARVSGKTSYLLNGNSSGSVLSAATAISSNVAISADSARLAAGRFSGSGGAALYIQSTSGTNYIASSVGSTITAGVHTPSLSALQPTTATGSTPGTFFVSDMGASRYNIPIAVPPGVQGLQPSVALSYSSSSRNGWVGMGWGITGLSRITRCGWTMAQDGENRAVALTTDDHFCLNGNRLRLTGGTYGAAGSTYQTELEEFSRITAYSSAGNGPQYFLVEGKDGRKYWYGATEDSRIQAVNSPTAPTTPHTWMLSQVQDRAGNTMTFSYFEDGAPEGSFRPSEIIYGAGTAQTYKLKFVWDPRANATDYVVDYTLGAAIRETFLLNRVETYYKPPGGSFQLVRKYQLGYQIGGTLRSQLTSVQECDGGGRCLTPTSAAWQQATSGWSSSEIPASVPSSNSYALDIDGDGRTDFIYLQSYNNFLTWYYVKANESGGFDSPVRTMYGVSDLNQSFAVPIRLAASARTGLLVNNGNFRYILEWTGSGLTPVYPPGTGGLTATPKGIWTGDFNGDGYSDILFAVLTGASSTQFYLQAGSATDFGSPQPFATMSAYGAANPVDPYNLARKIDFNGDGKDDLIVQTDSAGYGLNCSPELPECVPYQYDIHHWRAFVSTGSGLVQLAVSETGGCECQTYPVLPGDFNGDGLTDLVAGSWSESSPGSEDWSFHWNIRQGVSTGLTGPTAVTLPLTPYLIAGEFTGDGRSDVIYTTGYPNDPSQTWMLVRWTGTGFDTGVATGVVSSTLESVHSLDANGDSLTDIGYYAGGSYRVRPHNGPIPDLVQSIDDGFGNAFTLTYATLTDSTVYTKGGGAIFPLMDVQPPMPVVKQYIAADGSGGTYTISEKYSGLREDQWGRGSLGFAHREETDHRSNAEKVHQWDFSQDFPFIGMVSRDWVTQGLSASGPSISDTNYEPAYVQYGASPSFRYYAYVKKSTQTFYEVAGALNGQAVSEVVSTIDSVGTFGIPLSTTVKTKDRQSGSPWQNQVFTRATVNSDILDNQSTWCVLPRQATTTDTLPDSTSRTRTVTRTIDAAMCRTTDEYNEPSNAALRVDTHYEFDGCGNTRQIDVTGHNPDGTAMTLRRTALNYSYYTDRCVAPEKITNALSQDSFRTYRYDLGVQSGDTDANGLAVSWQYDGFGRRTREQRPDNTATDWFIIGCTPANSYCGSADAQVRAQVQEVDRDVLGSDVGSSTALLDGRGRTRLTGQQMSGGVWSYTAENYDALGRLSSKSLPYTQASNGKHRYSYDLRNRLTKDELLNASSGVDRFTTWAFSGGTVVVTDPKTSAGLHSGAASKQYDVTGQLRRVIDAAPGGTTKYDYTYDASGNQVVTVTDAANNNSTVTLDLLGHKTISDDADMGHWVFGYDSLGELKSQTDAKNQPTSYGYDALGRTVTRDEPEGQTVWTWGTNAAARNIGRLENVTSPGDPAVPGDQYKEEYTYDNRGRVQTVKYTQDGTYYVDYSYSDQGRLDTLTYPTSTSGYRLKLKYVYSNGQLMQVKDANDGTAFWTLNAIDDSGRTIDESFGNGLRQVTGYDSLTGTMIYRQSGTGSSTSNLQNLSYQWDLNGNLKQRRSYIQNPNLTEDFYYDTLNRLDYSQLNNNPSPNLDVTVNAIGNLTYKSDVGTYDYVTAQGACSYAGLTSQPHAVRNAGGSAYCYDANGNMTLRGSGTSVQWTSYNLPKQITQGTNSSQFLYGANRGRWKQVASYAGLPETTVYVAGLMEKVTVMSGTGYRHYIAVGDQAVIYTRWSTGANQIAYVTTDHLGSSSAVTDGNGASVVTESFDAFGQRRGGNWSGAPTPTDLTNISNTTRRGFTGHEHLDNLNLIHMNGRVFSPSLGRFMSADPFIQNAGDSQTLNRYSYVSNNPLTFVDPTGFGTVREVCNEFYGSDAMQGPPDDVETVTVQSHFVSACTIDMEPYLTPETTLVMPAAFVPSPRFDFPMTTDASPQGKPGCGGPSVEAPASPEPDEAGTSAAFAALGASDVALQMSERLTERMRAPPNVNLHAIKFAGKAVGATGTIISAYQAVLAEDPDTRALARQDLFFTALAEYAPETAPVISIPYFAGRAFRDWREAVERAEGQERAHRLLDDAACYKP